MLPHALSGSGATEDDGVVGEQHEDKEHGVEPARPPLTAARTRETTEPGRVARQSTPRAYRRTCLWTASCPQDPRSGPVSGRNDHDSINGGAPGDEPATTQRRTKTTSRLGWWLQRIRHRRSGDAGCLFCAGDAPVATVAGQMDDNGHFDLLVGCCHEGRVVTGEL